MYTNRAGVHWVGWIITIFILVFLSLMTPWLRTYATDESQPLTKSQRLKAENEYLELLIKNADLKNIIRNNKCYDRQKY